MSFSEISSFVLASIVLAFTPGPDILFVVVTALTNGFKTSLKFILGLATGIIFHTILIVIGVSTLVSQSSYGLTALKIFAVIYLLWLAYKTYVHRKDKLDLQSKVVVDNYYLRGFIMNITNPKVLLFFLAFFPQFATIGTANYQYRLIILGVLFIIITLCVFSFVAWLSAKGSKKFIENPKYSLFINWLAILVFVIVSLLLILT